MKKVKSLSDLKRMALAKGATLEVGGDRFNTTMERVSARQAEPEKVIEASPPAEVVPAPTKAVEPHVIQPVSVQESFAISLDMVPVADAIDAGNQRICESITKALKEIQVPAQAVDATGQHPCSWVFTVNRDTRGFIQSIDAKPTLSK